MTSILAISIKDIEITGYDNTMAFLTTHEYRQVGDQPMNRSVGVDPGAPDRVLTS